MRLGRMAADVGVGLAAGLVGTAAMTVSSTIEQKIRPRESSSTPADAASKVLGVEPTDEGRARFSQLVHIGYGTAWGAVRGLLATVGITGPTASAVHFALVWGAEQVMLPVLKVSPSATQWGASEIAIDGMHHAVYATTTGLAYEALDRNR